MTTLTIDKVNQIAAVMKAAELATRGNNVTAPTRVHKFSPRDKRVKPFVTALKAFRGLKPWSAQQSDAAAYFLQPPTK